MHAGATDNELLEFLIEMEVPTFSMVSGLKLEDLGWGTDAFRKMVRRVLERLARLGQ